MATTRLCIRQYAQANTWSTNIYRKLFDEGVIDESANDGWSYCKHSAVQCCDEVFSKEQCVTNEGNEYNASNMMRLSQSNMMGMKMWWDEHENPQFLGRQPTKMEMERWMVRNDVCWWWWRGPANTETLTYECSQKSIDVGDSIDSNWWDGW